MPRKPPHTVVSIKGDYKQDIITQEQLRKVAEAQEAEWRANKMAVKLVSDIEGRLLHGAAVEDGPLYFDRGLGMARSRKQRAK